jgi:DNA-binding NtrC family response regulator
MHKAILYLNPTSASGGDDPLCSDVRAAGWEVHVADSLRTADQLLSEHHYPVGLAKIPRDGSEDWRQSGIENWANLEAFLSRLDNPRWIALTPPDALDHDHICQLITTGFFDYHTLPHDPTRLLASLGHAYGMSRLGANDDAAKHSVNGEHEMVGTGAAMQALFHSIRKIAGVDAPVLIGGESGTGKELAALAIHARSARADGPFITVNCGALPDNLIQSELFGHEKGAFTSAHQRNIGRFEAAAGGSIFLDEIGDLPLALQVNLLRFLQEKTIERVGGTRSIPVDVRVIAATHANLEQAVAEGRFREDLYYRLNVLNLEVPALRERVDDIELLARFFFNKFSSEKNRRVRDFSQQALSAMCRYDWPGNVRELINRIRRAMVMCDRRLIMPGDLGLDQQHHECSIMTLDQARSEAEINAIRNSLNATQHNVSKAARLLGISRVTLYRIAEKNGVRL